MIAVTYGPLSLNALLHPAAIRLTRLRPTAHPLAWLNRLDVHLTSAAKSIAGQCFDAPASAGQALSFNRGHRILQQIFQDCLCVAVPQASVGLGLFSEFEGNIDACSLVDEPAFRLICLSTFVANTRSTYILSESNKMNKLFSFRS